MPTRARTTASAHPGASAFEAALAGRIPDGVVLSHDLLEGLYARAGLVSDVELFDDAPR